MNTNGMGRPTSVGSKAVSGLSGGTIDNKNKPPLEFILNGNINKIAAMKQPGGMNNGLLSFG